RPSSTRSATPASMPLFSKSKALPCSDGKTSTGRPQCPCTTTAPAPPAAGAGSSTWSRRTPYLPEQPRQVRVETVPPGGVVVRVPVLDELDPVSLRGECAPHQPVVLEVLLHRPAGQHRGHRPGRVRRTS